MQRREDDGCVFYETFIKYSYFLYFNCLIRRPFVNNEEGEDKIVLVNFSFVIINTIMTPMTPLH